jgi:hypothetical protein
VVMREEGKEEKVTGGRNPMEYLCHRPVAEQPTTQRTSLSRPTPPDASRTNALRGETT